MLFMGFTQFTHVYSQGLALQVLVAPSLPRRRASWSVPFLRKKLRHTSCGSTGLSDNVSLNFWLAAVDGEEAAAGPLRGFLERSADSLKWTGCCSCSRALLGFD